MELDELKQAWKQVPVETKKTDIMEFVHLKDSGPVAAMKQVFRKQMLAMSLIPFVLILTNTANLYAVFSSIMFWSYVCFCIGIVTFSWYNYRLVSKMEGMAGMVKNNLEQQINLLEKRMQMEIMGLRVIMLFFIVLAETVPFIQHSRLLDKWHSLDPLIRFGSYAALLLIQFFLNRKIKKQRLGVHIDHLKEMVKEMQ